MGIVLCQLPQILVLTSSTLEENTLVVKTVFSPGLLRSRVNSRRLNGFIRYCQALLHF